MLLKLVRHGVWSDAVQGSLYYSGDLNMQWVYLCETFEHNPDRSSAGDEHCFTLLEADCYPIEIVPEGFVVHPLETMIGPSLPVEAKFRGDVLFLAPMIALTSGRKPGKKAVELFPPDEKKMRKFLNEATYGHRSGPDYLQICNHPTI